MSNSLQQSQLELCPNNYSPEYEYNYSLLLQLSPSSNEKDENSNSSQPTQETNDTKNPLDFMRCYVLLTRCEVNKIADPLNRDTESDLNRQIQEFREEREEHLPSQNQQSQCLAVENNQTQEEVDDKEANRENLSPMSNYSYYHFPSPPSPWP